MIRFFFLCTLFASCTQGQHKAPLTYTLTKAVTGSYKMSKEHDPSGTPTLLVMDGNRYVIAYFGGAQVGSWKIVKDSFVVFMPDTVAAPYALYGRHNPFLKDSLRMFFGGFSEESCFVGVGTTGTTLPVLTSVFNESPNCISYPNVYTFVHRGGTISFTNQSYDEGTGSLAASPIFTFPNPEGYNDFIAHHFPKKDNGRPFYALYRKGLLYFDQFADIYFQPGLGNHLEDILDGKGNLYSYSTDGFAKGPLPITGEDATFINGLAIGEALADTVLYNPFYKPFDMDGVTMEQHYTYNPDKAAYLGSAYTEGEERGNPNEFYNSGNVLYLFKALAGTASPSTHFTINKKPLFHFTCEEGTEE